MVSNGDVIAAADIASGSLQYAPPTNQNGNGLGSFSFSVSDGTVFAASPSTMTIDVMAVNDAPTLDGGTATLTATSEDTNSVATTVSSILADTGYADVDAGGVSGLAVTGVSASGTWQYSTDGTTWTDFGTVSSSDALLLDSASQVRFAPDTENGETATFAFKAWDQTTGNASANGSPQKADTATDGGATAFSSTTGTGSITVSDVNDAPVLTPAAPTFPTITEDATGNAGAQVSTLLGANVSDVDSGASEGIAITGLTSGNGTWQYSTDGGTTWSDVGTVTNTSALLLRATDNLRFVPNGENGTSADITYRAWDQTSGSAGNKVDASANGSPTAFSTATDTAAITVTDVNDAPTFAGLPGTASFTEGGSRVVLDGDVTVADVELDAANDFAGASLSVARNGGANANDSFGFDTSTASFTVSSGNLQSGGNTFATFTNTGGTLSVSFTSSGTAATGALVDDVLQHVTYENTGNDPVASAQLDWTFDDGGGQGTGGALTDTDTVTVSITSVNDAPTASTTADDPTFTEGGAAATPFSGAAVDPIEAGQTIAGFTFTVANLADGSDEVAVVDGTDITLTDTTSGTTTGNSLNYSVSVAGSTATVTLSNGSLSAADAETVINGIAYRNDSEAPSTGSTRDFALTEIIDSGGTPNGGDDTGTPTGGASSVTVAAVNTAPVLGGINGETSQIVAGAGAQNVDLLDDATASDADSADFATGSLSIAQGPGTANGSWGLDGTNATSGGDGTIANGETVAVGGTGIGTVTDDGQSGNSLTIALNANAAPPLVQTLLQNFTYSAPTGLGDRGFTLTLDDGDGGAATDTAGFTIDVAPNPPTISNLDTDVLSYTEGDAAQVLDQGTAAAVTDPDSANFDGGNVTVSITGGGDAAEDAMSIRNEGTGAGEIGFDGTNVTFGGTQIGTAAGGTGGADLVVTLDDDATPTATGALLQNLTYENTDTDDPTGGTRTISVSVADAGTSAASDTVTLTVDVTPVNDPPVAQNDDFGTTENTQITGEDVLVDNGNGADGDPDDTPTVGQVAGSAGNIGTATAGSNGGQFTITAAGALTFDPGTDFDSLAQGDTDTTTVTYTLSDGSLTDTATVTVTVNGANDAPSGADSSQNVRINRTVEIEAADFGFTDPDSGDTLQQVTIDAVPATGTLFIDGSTGGTDDGRQDGETALGDGATVAAADLNAGNLLYVTPTTTGVTDTITFTVQDNNGQNATAANTLTLTSVAGGGGGGGAPSDQPTVEEETTIGPDGEGQKTTEVNPGDEPTEVEVGDEGGGPPSLSLGLPAGVGGTVEGKTQKQSGQQARDDLLSRIGASGGDSDETQELQDKAQKFLDSLPEGSEVTITSITPSVEGDQAPDDPIEINGNADPDSIESTVIDTRNLPSGTQLNINGVENVTFIGDVQASGGAGNNNASGDGGSQFIVLGPGDDTISGGGGADSVGSEGGDDIVYGNAGDDYAFGGADSDQVYGNQGVDEVYGNQGDDLVFGGQDPDLVFGGQGSDQVYGNKTDDQVYGNKADDLGFGGQGDDDLFGGQGNDLIYGNLGDDRIYGNAGDDTLYGGDGADAFAVLSGDGQDTVADFGDGDTIALQSDINGSGVESFADLTITENADGDAVIDLAPDVIPLDAGASVTVTGVAPSELSESDFSFF